MEIPKSSDDSIIIGLCGDVMIGRLVNEMLSSVDRAYLWGDTLPLLQATDFNLINLEAALTVSEEEVPKVFNFKAEPDRVEVLKLASVDVVNLANNHCLDYAESGLLETLDVLNEAEIQSVGAGRNTSEARKPLVMDVQGIKIGILGYTDNEPSWIATAHSPGTNYVNIDEKALKRVKKEVQELKKQADVVIVTIHWGPNMRQRPPQHFKHFARELMDSGADIFHGHSAHIFQGVEIYHRKVIFYDTGDYVDDYYVDPFLRNDQSFFFTVEVTKNGVVGVRLFPTLISNCQVNLAKRSDKTHAIERMTLLSKEFHTDLMEEDDSLVAKIRPPDL